MLNFRLLMSFCLALFCLVNFASIAMANLRGCQTASQVVGDTGFFDAIQCKSPTGCSCSVTTCVFCGPMACFTSLGSPTCTAVPILRKPHHAR